MARREGLLALKALGKGSVASLVKAGLGVAWYALWFAAIAWFLAAVGYGVLLSMVASGAVDPAVLTGGEGEVKLGEHGDGSFSVTYDEPGGLTWPVMVPAFLSGAVVIAGAMVIVWRLRALFDSFSSGEPFRAGNADHLRAIWIAMLVIELTRYALMALTGVLLAAFGPPAGAQAHIEVGVDITTWLSILVLIVLAEVFRVGAKMREEQDLTI